MIFVVCVSFFPLQKSRIPQRMERLEQQQTASGQQFPRLIPRWIPAFFRRTGCGGGFSLRQQRNLDLGLGWVGGNGGREPAPSPRGISHGTKRYIQHYLTIHEWLIFIPYSRIPIKKGWFAKVWCFQMVCCSQFLGEIPSKRRKEAAEVFDTKKLAISQTTAAKMKWNSKSRNIVEPPISKRHPENLTRNSKIWWFVHGFVLFQAGLFQLPH